MLDVAVTGCDTATIAPDILAKLLAHTTTDTSIAGFAADWKKAFGDHTLPELLKSD